MQIHERNSIPRVKKYNTNKKDGNRLGKRKRKEMIDLVFVSKGHLFANANVVAALKNGTNIKVKVCEVDIPEYNNMPSINFEPEHKKKAGMFNSFYGFQVLKNEQFAIPVTIA